MFSVFTFHSLSLKKVSFKSLKKENKVVSGSYWLCTYTLYLFTYIYVILKSIYILSTYTYICLAAQLVGSIIGRKKWTIKMPNSGLVAWKMMMFNYIIFLALSLSIDGSKAQLSENSRSPELGPSFSKAGQPSVRIKPIDISNHLCISHVQASVFLALVELEPPFFGDFRLWQC